MAGPLVIPKSWWSGRPTTPAFLSCGPAAWSPRRPGWGGSTLTGQAERLRVKGDPHLHGRL